MNQRRRRKHLNPIDAPALARWVVISIFGAATGLSYVYLTVQLHHLGVQRHAIEQEMVAIHAQNEDAHVQIGALTSRVAIERRLKEGYLKLVPIIDQSIVRLNPAAHRSGEDEVQPVVNRGGVK